MNAKAAPFSGKPRVAPIRIGISSCLLGERVRYDGGHKQDHYLTDTLGKYFEWVPVCPEIELGLGTPRDTMRLESREDGLHLIVPRTRRDLTKPMRDYAERRIVQLAGEDLCGYILKSDSPSCGIERVRVYGSNRIPARSGRGLFAEALRRYLPSLPVVEEGRLCDPTLRENWIERVFVYHRLQSFWKSRWTRKDLVGFHTAHKLTILAHSPGAYKSLGCLVANPGITSRQRLRERYQEILLEAMGLSATRGTNTNVLQHMAGYFKHRLGPDSRRELTDLIEEYRRGKFPLIVPVTLIRHYVRRFGIEYLAGQTYLNPHPKELALRNHV